jgi:hypothetical protein
MNLKSNHYLIIVLALATAVLHIVAAFDKQLYPESPDPLFILNGLGYIGLLGAYFLPIAFFQSKHELVRKGFMGYTILTIVAWIWIWVIQYVIIRGENFFAHDSLYGVPAKITEVILFFTLRNDQA